MKLKTLRDIREKGIRDICKNIKAEPDALCSFGALGMMSVEELVTTFLRDDLRRAAIEWIKKLQSDHPYESGDKVFNMDQYIKGQIDWIKQFFNIKDEELK